MFSTILSRAGIFLGSIVQLVIALAAALVTGVVLALYVGVLSLRDGRLSSEEQRTVEIKTWSSFWAILRKASFIRVD